MSDIFQIFSMLYLADIYNGISLFVDWLLAFAVIFFTFAVVGYAMVANSMDGDRDASRYGEWARGKRLPSIIILILVLGLWSTMPSAKFVERTAYAGVGIKLTTMAMDALPDSIKNAASDEASRFAMQGMKIPGNVAVMMNGWIETKIEELGEEFLKSEDQLDTIVVKKAK